MLESIDTAYTQTASRLNVAREVIFSIIDGVFAEIDARAEECAQIISSHADIEAVRHQMETWYDISMQLQICSTEKL